MPDREGCQSTESFESQTLLNFYERFASNGAMGMDLTMHRFNVVTRFFLLSLILSVALASACVDKTETYFTPKGGPRIGLSKPSTY